MLLPRRATFGPISPLQLSTQLAILAAAAIDRRVDDALIALRLAGDAGAHARQRLAPLLRDRLAAIVAFLGALALGRQRAGAQHGVFHRVLDLLFDRAVARPSAGHVALLFLRRSNIGMERAARYRRGDRAFEPALAHGGNAEDPVVD